MMTDLKYRTEIDGLRALAIISVVIFHFFPHIMPSGFLGVDIFFVISGYLITNHFISLQKNNTRNSSSNDQQLGEPELFLKDRQIVQ